MSKLVQKPSLDPDSGEAASAAKPVRERRSRADAVGNETSIAMTDQDKPVAAEKPNPPANLYEAIRSRFAKFGDIELEIPPRGPMREPPSFD